MLGSRRPREAGQLFTRLRSTAFSSLRPSASLLISKGCVALFSQLGSSQSFLICFKKGKEKRNKKKEGGSEGLGRPAGGEGSPGVTSALNLNSVLSSSLGPKQSPNCWSLLLRGNLPSFSAGSHPTPCSARGSRTHHGAHLQKPHEAVKVGPWSGGDLGQRGLGGGFQTEVCAWLGRETVGTASSEQEAYGGWHHRSKDTQRGQRGQTQRH